MKEDTRSFGHQISRDDAVGSSYWGLRIISGGGMKSFRVGIDIDRTEHENQVLGSNAERTRILKFIMQKRVTPPMCDRDTNRNEFVNELYNQLVGLRHQEDEG